MWFKFREQQSLWSQVMLKKYCKKVFPGKVKAKNTNSLIWKRLVRVGASTQEHCFWQIGQGVCYYWEDEWLDKGKLANFATSPYDSTELVQSYGLQNNWNNAKISSKLPLHISISISLLPFSRDTDAQPI